MYPSVCLLTSIGLRNISNNFYRRKRADTPAENQTKTKKKRIRKNSEIADARIAGWRVVDQKKECFLMPTLPPAQAFPDIGLSRFSRVEDIFLHFVDGEVISKLIDSLTPQDIMIGYRDKSKGTIRRMNITPQLVYKTFAVHIRIIGLQVQPNEAHSVRRPLRDALEECQEHFHDLDCPGIDYLTKLTSVLVFDESMEEVLSLKFQSALSRLGQFVAGDEKLFHFTGQSGDVRLVKSKPDQIGLWFYELCCRLRCGLPYLLHLQLHRNKVQGQVSVKVSDMVKRWGHVVQTIGGHLEPNRAFDSYYMDAEARRYLREERLLYCASAQAARFSAEINLVHENTIDVIGEHRAIYNEITQELFVYHYDTQKGVGKKYNLSYGLIRSEERLKVREHYGAIPGYDVYKSLFEACDNFNRGLHDKSWPHRRGGRGRAGHFGRSHDFIFACTLQNTFNIFTDMGGYFEGNMSFRDKCLELSDRIYNYAKTM